MVDSFFTDPNRSKRKRAAGAKKSARAGRDKAGSKRNHDEDEITSEEEEPQAVHSDESSEDEYAHETETDKRRRLAKEYLSKIEQEEFEQQGGGDENAFDAKAMDREIIARRLKEDVAENKGRVYRRLAAGLDFDGSTGRLTTCKHYPLTSVAASVYPHVYSTSKDGALIKWAVDKQDGSAKIVKIARGDKRRVDEATSVTGHTDEILAVAVSGDGRYVVTGGRDKRVIVWSGENLRLMRVLDTRDRRGTVLGLAFRRGTADFYGACEDLKVRTYNADQQAHIETLFGHQDGVVDVCCLAQERCVSVGGRDRSAILWKIADETRLTFRGADAAAAEIAAETKTKAAGRVFEGSIDCCTMVDETLFVTGSDNGSVSLWATGKKKPIFVVREAHGRDDRLAPELATADLALTTATSNGTSPPVAGPEPMPRAITAVYAIPYSDVFFTASYDGRIKAWKLSQDNRRFELAHSMEASGLRGVVNRIAVLETGTRNKEQFTLVAAVSREPRLGRWMKMPGKNGLFVTTLSRR